jgi:hypothetical protein
MAPKARRSEGRWGAPRLAEGGGGAGGRGPRGTTRPGRLPHAAPAQGGSARRGAGLRSYDGAGCAVASAAHKGAQWGLPATWSTSSNSRRQMGQCRPPREASRTEQAHAWWRKCGQVRRPRSVKTPCAQWRRGVSGACGEERTRRGAARRGAPPGAGASRRSTPRTLQPAGGRVGVSAPRGGSPARDPPGRCLVAQKAAAPRESGGRARGGSRFANKEPSRAVTHLSQEDGGGDAAARKGGGDAPGRRAGRRPPPPPHTFPVLTGQVSSLPPY